jgi:ABC-type methionine transport system ATPase subunit
MQMSIGLTFPGTLKDESVISYICKNFNIDLRIIEASFSMSSGWAILQIEGEEEEIKKVFEYLTSKDVQIQKIEKRSEDEAGQR